VAARLPRGVLEIAEGDVVGVRVAGAGAGLRANAGALADVARGLLHRPFLEDDLFVDAVLQVDVGVVDAALQRAAQDPLHQRWRHVEAVGEEALGPDESRVAHVSIRLL
jgi:hypothetical protein